VWTDKESRLSLEGEVSTLINRIVKLVLGDLALAFIYGLTTVIHAKRIAPHPIFLAIGYRWWCIQQAETRFDRKPKQLYLPPSEDRTPLPNLGSRRNPRL
jgi:hypothetical protein